MSVKEMTLKEGAEKEAAHQGMPVYQNYKDRVFRMLFHKKERLLELYNALNGTEYTNVEDLTVNTLENAIYINMRNDVSFIIDSNMCLYEHQSTYCPNMPLRGLLYFTDIYKKQFKDIDLSVRKMIKIPTPYYIVFYNGIEKKEEEFTQRLSDAFENTGEGCMELKVRVININFGHNRELLDKCKNLYGYAYFVAEIRKNLMTMELNRAVESAVEECIRKDILKDFLLEQKAEVIAMSIYEYNEEYVRKSFFEDGEKSGYDRGMSEGIEIGKSEGIEIGKSEGIAIGKSEGENKLSMLISLLLAENKVEEVRLVSQNKEIREEYYQKYRISEMRSSMEEQ